MGNRLALPSKSTLVLAALVALTAPLLPACQPRLANDGSQTRNVLNYFRTTQYKSLDPPRQFDAVSMGIINNVYDTLLEYHYLKRPYDLTPNLLTQMPELAEDQVTYTFTLRSGIKFHDDPCFPGGQGRELTTDDVLYTIKRFSDANINTRSYQVLLEGRIKGLDAFREQTRQNPKIDHAQTQVEGLKKIDDTTFQIILTEPDPLALMSFASSALAILPPEAVAHYGEKLTDNPVGTGPYTLAKNDRRGEVVLKKNPNYHGRYPSEGEPDDERNGLLADAGKTLPLIDEVRMPLIEEEQPRMLKFLKGGIDWIGFDRNNFEKMAYKDAQGFHLKDEFAEKFKIYASPSLAIDYYRINMNDQVLGANQALRQAIAYALDTPTYIDKMRNGRGVPLNTVVPLAIAGSERTVPAQWYTSNLEKAKQKLVDAGYPNGQGLPPITIEYRRTTTLIRQNHEFVRAQLAKIGIQVEGKFQTFTNFLRKVEAGNFQIADSAWLADYPDAENFYQLLYGPNKAPGPNAGSYQNAKYDQLYQQMRRMSPGPARDQVMLQMANLIKADVPFIPTVNPISVGMHQPWLGNFKRHQLIEGHFKFLSIDPTAKAKGVQ